MLILKLKWTRSIIGATWKRDSISCVYLNYRPQRSWAKVIFSQACVKNSVHRGGGEGVCLSACWDTPPQEQTPPNPPELTPPPREQTPPPPRGSRLQHRVNERAGTHPTGMHSCLFYKLTSLTSAKAARRWPKYPGNPGGRGSLPSADEALISETRKHSSRMRITRLLTVSSSFPCISGGGGSVQLPLDADHPCRQTQGVACWEATPPL